MHLLRTAARCAVRCAMLQRQSCITRRACCLRSRKWIWCTPHMRPCIRGRGLSHRGNTRARTLPLFTTRFPPACPLSQAAALTPGRGGGEGGVDFVLCTWRQSRLAELCSVRCHERTCTRASPRSRYLRTGSRSDDIISATMAQDASVPGSRLCGV